MSDLASDQKLEIMREMARRAQAVQAEINAAGLGDPRDQRIADLEAEIKQVRDVAWKQGNRADEAEVEIERLRQVETAAKEYIAHSDQGYAAVVSYTIRLREALDAQEPR